MICLTPARWAAAPALPEQSLSSRKKSGANVRSPPGADPRRRYQVSDFIHWMICLIPTKSAVVQTTAVEFQRKSGEFQHKALREPVEITGHGRRELLLLSADQNDWLIAAARRTHRTENAAAVVIEAVERAEMDPEHAHLDKLIE